MSVSEIELLQLPVDGPLPCGEDLEYDPDFMALQQAAVGKAEQQFGSTIIPAEAPDWARVERGARQLCERTRDLRVLVLLTLAWTESRGLPGYVDGLRVIGGLLSRFWSELHPQVTNGGEEDPLPRMNALATLADPGGLGRRVRDAILLEDGVTAMSLRQVEALLDSSRTDQVDYPGGVPRLREALVRARQNGAPGVVALSDALSLLQQIRETTERALGQNWAPDFSRLERSLRTVSQLLPAAPEAAPLSNSEVSAPTPDVVTSGNDVSVKANASELRSGRAADVNVASREDVQVLLEKVCQYLERAEPSHPSPMLIRRAQRLLDLNFFQIIEDLVPEGLQKIEALAGRSPNGGASTE